MPDEKTFFFRLTDDNQDAGSFVVTLEEGSINVGDIDNDCQGVTQQLDVYDGDGETLLLSVDGNAWRDLEAGDFIPDFVRDVLCGDLDAQTFFNDIAVELDVDTPGEVL